MNLSPRETEVMRLIMAGLISKEIAERLGLSPKTIDSHRANAMLKLGARTMPHAVALWMMGSINHKESEVLGLRAALAERG